MFLTVVIAYLIICFIFIWYHRVSAAAHVPVSVAPSLPSEYVLAHAPQSPSLSDPVLHPVLPIPSPSVGEPLDNTRGEEIVPGRATSTPMKSSARFSTGIELFSSSIPEIHELEDEFNGSASAPSRRELSFEEAFGSQVVEAGRFHAEPRPAVVQPIEVKDPVQPSEEQRAN